MTKPMNVLFDIAIVAAVSFAAYWAEGFAIDRGWIPFGAVVRGASAAIAGALAAGVVVVTRGGSLSELGFRRPERWTRFAVQVGAILIAFAVTQGISLTLASAVFSMPEPDLSRYDELAGDPASAIVLALMLPLTASIPEEVIYRGFLIGRLSSVLGADRRRDIISVCLQAMLFGAAHFSWGVGGMVAMVVMGLVWGTAYLVCERNLWPLIVAHSIGHVLGALQLYAQTSIIL